jgi:hypothetical protein
VLLAGGGLGNAVLFSIARALRERQSRVVYFAGYKRPDDLFKRDEIEAACDQIIWSVDAGDLIEPRRLQDRSFRGNIAQAMVAYAHGAGEAVQPLPRLPPGACARPGEGVTSMGAQPVGARQGLGIRVRLPLS